MTAKPFGLLPDGRQAHLYKIRFGNLEAEITDFGATLVSLTAPDSQGSAVCLETQYYPDAVHHSHWPQPIVKAGEKYFSETRYVFK